MTSLLVDDEQNGKTLTENFISANGTPAVKTNGAHHVNGHGHSINGHDAHSPATNGAHQLPEDVIVRPYQPADRPAICRICCDTGFLGNPIETIFSDREIFANLFAGPYLDYGPDWAWVAESEGKVVGYLLGSVSPTFDYALLYSGFQTTMKMITRAATGCYTGHPRNRQFIRWLLTHGYREQPRHPDNAAHLHLNVEKPWRGRGLGLRLWETYERQLTGAGIHDCYGAFFSWPRRRPEAVYSRLGFSVFDRKLTTIFRPEIPEPVEVVCVQKKIAP
jgi:GNAT superfamily N-acetyltransferase